MFHRTHFSNTYFYPFCKADYHCDKMYIGNIYTDDRKYKDVTTSFERTEKFHKKVST